MEMKKAVTLTLAIVLLFSVIIGTLNLTASAAQPGQEGIITITESGDVKGTDMLQRDGNTYRFKGSINGAIVIKKDHIVLDGAGYTLQQSGDSSIGVNLDHRNGVTVKNLVITGFLGTCGILLTDAENCNIIKNSLKGNFIGIHMSGRASYNKISENLIQNNSQGMEMYSVTFSNYPVGTDNTISQNEVKDNHYGMEIKNFLNTKVSDNKISSNTWGLGLGLGSGSTAKNNVLTDNTYGFRAYNIQAVNVDIDTSNTVNGKLVYFWVDQHDKTVPADACYVALVGCSGITAKNLNLHGNFDGVFLGSTTNSTITNNKASRNVFGINLDASSNNLINGNLITGNENGVNLRENSTNNIVQGNDINANTAVGIYIATSDTNSITANSIANNNRGVVTEYCPKTNTFLQNNLLNNTKQWDDIAFTTWPIHLEFSKGIWDDGKAGNFWSDYNGTDQDGDGIGDVPNVLGTDNTDHYPLMKPVNVTLEIPEFPEDKNLTEPEPFPTALLATASGVSVAAVTLGLIYHFKKHNHQP